MLSKDPFCAPLGTIGSAVGSHPLVNIQEKIKHPEVADMVCSRVTAGLRKQKSLDTEGPRYRARKGSIQSGALELPATDVWIILAYHFQKAWL